MRVTAILPHYYFSAREGIPDFLFWPLHESIIGMLERLETSWLVWKKVQATLLVSPSWSILKGGSQVEKLQDEGFIRSGASLERIGCLWMRSHYQAQLSLLKMCYLLNQGARVFSCNGYNFNGLTKWELHLFYYAAVFLLVRNLRFLVLAYTREYHWDVRMSWY